MSGKKDLSFLGRRLKELRESHGLSMDDMIKKLDKELNYKIENRSSISRAEKGAVTEKTLLTLKEQYCKLFKLNPVQIAELENGLKIAIPDTSALLNNPQLITYLNTEYNKVIIPTVVLDELTHIKNNPNDTKNAKIAWKVLRGISSGDSIVKMDYSGNEIGINNDRKIICVAKNASESYYSKVEIITEDTDYSAYLKGDETVSALHLKDYLKRKQRLLNIERMKYYDSLCLDSYDDIEPPTKEEADGYFDKKGYTLIISTVVNENMSFEKKTKKITWLIKNGADIDKRDLLNNNFPALTYAVQRKDVAMVKFLVNECNANPNIGSRNPLDSGYLSQRQKNEGNMPLMVAAWKGNEEIVRFLCENSKTSINQQDANGYTALMKACMNGNTRCRDILQEHNADEKIVDINGMTAMDHYNDFLENGPQWKRLNKGYKNKHYSKKLR